MLQACDALHEFASTAPIGPAPAGPAESSRPANFGQTHCAKLPPSVVLCRALVVMPAARKLQAFLVDPPLGRATSAAAPRGAFGPLVLCRKILRLRRNSAEALPDRFAQVGMRVGCGVRFAAATEIAKAL